MGQRGVLGGACLLVLAGAVYMQQQQGARMAVLFGIGVLLGATLYLAAFGFAGAYRAFINHRRAEGINAQLLLLALATLVFAPLLSQGELFGQRFGGALAPVGVSVAVGAFLFGIGMQLGDGCASGTLFTLGGGSRRMLLTLVGFMAGSVLATYHMPFWWKTPSLEPVSLGQSLGWPVAVVVQLAVLGAIYLLVRRLEAKSPAEQGVGPAPRIWPLWLGAVGLVLLNIATLLAAGHPWSIAWGYTLWGAKLAHGLGLDIASTVFWGSGYPRQALGAGLLTDVTSLMNFGIIIGAAAVAGFAGRFLPPLRINVRQAMAAVVGGVLMGYGARLAFGCNIGAFFSGVASFSLHGWLWILAAFPGTWLGVRLRPLFAMDSVRAVAPQALAKAP
ncbi:MAG: YeeE/YedE family protein [Gammaproteobacteria bacterium]|nr:MAG: YeeE/YedE family protein [Gammaproteobacteria bacterium]